MTALQAANDCDSADDGFRRRSVTALARTVIARLDRFEGEALIDRLAASSCKVEAVWFHFLRALARRDGRAIIDAAETLQNTVDPGDPDLDFLIEAVLFANLLEGEPDANVRLWRELPAARQRQLIAQIPIRLMLAHSGWRAAASDESR